jgi:enoyl-CoA hydratase/carnithine racemase
MKLSSDIEFQMQNEIAFIKLNRASKRNALNDELVESIKQIFENIPKQAKVAILHGSGDHFCAGLDLSEIKERDAPEGMFHSRSWHTALDRLQFGPVPVIAALHGAVVGGGLELASACHIRVADETTFFALPEGTRGIFVGGGGSVRIPKLIGVSRMIDMMMTGRVYKAAEGERIGLTQYIVPVGNVLEKAVELAKKVASNAPLTNYALIHALPKIAEQASDHGFLMEALMSSITQSAPEAKKRVRDFLEGHAAKVKA